MTVVFSTYQSIDVIAEAQQQGLGDFDLVVCDEAHRTTGVTLAGETRVRVRPGPRPDYLKARKRLYMTATPRVFGDDVSKKATTPKRSSPTWATRTFGRELHRLGFGDAVEADLLTDYKVLVLAVRRAVRRGELPGRHGQSGEIKLDDAAKLIGCWNGLAKHFGDHRNRAPGAPMRTAVAFAKDIRASKTAAAGFPDPRGPSRSRTSQRTATASRSRPPTWTAPWASTNATPTSPG